MQRTINRFLARVGMNLHSQNTNDLPGGRLGPMWRNGRAWLWLKQDERGANPMLGLSWAVTTRFVHAYVTLGGEDDFVVSVAAPGLALWLSGERVLPGWLRRRLPRDDGYTTGLSYFHEGRHLTWKLHYPEMESPRMPRWRYWSVFVDDLLFGKAKYSTRVLSSTETVVPMPEKAYPATVTITEATWQRPRWFTERRIRAEVEVPGGVPHPGKGENAWDCGEDATHSLTTLASTAEEAIGKFVASVLRDRAKYGGRNWRPQAVPA